MKFTSNNSRTVRDLGEFGLIRRLAKHFSPAKAIVGIGDDCAVLPCGDRKKYLLYTCDPVVEGIHFTPRTPPRRVGWKAMARNLSDIAAMGGLPRWAVVSIGLRPNTRVRYVEQCYDGLQSAAARFGCAIVGGDTTHVKHEQFIVVTLIGEVEKSKLVLRSGSKVGDAVFVTGKLGGSLRGKHLTFIPRITEARWLVEHFSIHAMIDLSDGLTGDLQRLVEAGNVGFEINSRQIPANHSLRAALTDGEDFELLFTVSSRDASRLMRRWPFRLSLSKIGSASKRNVVLLDGQPLNAQGYDHFARD